jgi:hypothetical protein
MNGNMQEKELSLSIAENTADVGKITDVAHNVADEGKIADNVAEVEVGK